MQGLFYWTLPMVSFPTTCDRCVITQEQAGWILGWCNGNKSTAHVSAAIISNHFGIEVHCRFSDNILRISLFGEDADLADQVMTFASAFKYEDELLFDRVIVDITRLLDSGPLTESNPD